MQLCRFLHGLFLFHFRRLVEAMERLAALCLFCLVVVVLFGLLGDQNTPALHMLCKVLSFTLVEKDYL